MYHLAPPGFLLNTAVNPQHTICNSIAVPHQQPPNKKTTITPGCRHFRGVSYVSNQGKLYLRTATMPPVDMKTRRESSRPSASKVVTKLTHSHLKIGMLPSKGKACIPTIPFQVLLLLVSGRVKAYYWWSTNLSEECEGFSTFFVGVSNTVTGKGSIPT